MKASDYRLKKQQTQPIFEVVCRSGATFRCFKPNLSPFVANGKLPDFFKSQMAIFEMNQELPEDELKEKIAQNEDLQNKILGNLLFMRDLILRNVVEPKIVENPQSENELGYDEITQDDFNDLSVWLITGGETANSVEKFRQG